MGTGLSQTAAIWGHDPDARGYFTPAQERQYRAAFTAIRDQITAKQRLMLRHHYHAPDKTITARRLAKQVGYKDWRGVNSQYGRLAKRLCGALGMQQPPEDRVWESVLATWTRDPAVEDGEVLLVMRPQVADALAALALV